MEVVDDHKYIYLLCDDRWRYYSFICKLDESRHMALTHKIRYKIKELVDLDEIWKGRRVRRAEFSGLLEIFIN